MRVTTGLLLAAATLTVAACGSAEPAPRPALEAPAKAAPVEPAVSKPSTPTRLPPGAQPLLGTWSADLATCGDQRSVVVISAGRLTSAARTCDITLVDNNDGSFAAACGEETLHLTPVFAPSGDGINLVVDDGKRETLLRCGRN